jgi:plasmid stabilization system protein ParE
MRYEFHPEALDEYIEAGHYYGERQPGLDLRFIVSVEAAIENILEDPYRWRPFDEDVRRCFTRVFPYAVLYTIEPDYVLIIAVAHCSREPGYWKRRIQK